MDRGAKVRHSKFLSFVLRHDPSSIGITLDDAGWVEVNTLLAQCAKHRHSISRDQLNVIVSTSPKRRFALNEDGARIRANQGHSVPVQLGLDAVTPPEFLFHGTGSEHSASIEAEGLLRMARHHVHLSPDLETARSVGTRKKGTLTIYKVDSRQMCDENYEFFCSANNVWLTETVPPRFLEKL